MIPQVTSETMDRYFGRPPYDAPQFVAGQILQNLERRSLGLDHFNDTQILFEIGAEAAAVVAATYPAERDPDI